MKSIDKILLGVLSVLAVFSGTLLTDYVLAGKSQEEKVIQLGAQTEVGTRVGGTSASYRVTTTSFSFYVNPGEFYQIKEGDLVKLDVSPMYHQVNTYQVVDKMDAPNSFMKRILVGMWLPLLTIGLCITSYVVKNVPQLLWAGVLAGIFTLALFLL